MQKEKEFTKKELELVEKTKKLSVVEGGAYSVMDGFGVRYVTPYALSSGASNTHIGLLSSLPGLLGNLSQLLTFHFMKKFTRKKILFWGILLQSLMWFLLILAGIPFHVFDIKGSLSPNLIIIVYTVLVLFGSFAGPAWTSLVRDLVPFNRGSFFGKRNQVVGAVALVCIFSAGFLLDYFKQTRIYLGFIIMFTIAAAGRMASAFLFKKYYEPKYVFDDSKYFSIFSFIKRMRNNNFGRFVLYYALLSFSVSIAGPFFVVYMLKDLGFSYTYYMATIIFHSLVTLIVMPFWGKFIDRHGSIKVMKITGFFVPILPALWLLTPFVEPVTRLVVFVVFLEVLSGFIWSGFNLAASNFIYDAVTKERLTICSSYFNIINGFFVLVGALIGGYLSSNNITIYGLNPILFLFGLSALLRLGVYFFYSNKIREVRQVIDYNFGVKVGHGAKKFIKTGAKLNRATEELFVKTGIIPFKWLNSLSISKFFETKNSESEQSGSSNTLGSSKLK